MLDDAWKAEKKAWGLQLHRLIKQKGWTQAEFSRQADMARNNVNTYVNGRSYPSEESLAKMARALGMTMEALLPDWQAKQQNNVRSRTQRRQAPPPGISFTPIDEYRSWLRVNWPMKTSTALEIMVLIKQDRDGGDPSNNSGLPS